MIRIWFSDYRYNHMNNVRVHKRSMKVERLFITKIEVRQSGRTSILQKQWKVVDAFTTYETNAPNVCPKEHLSQLLQTAF